MNLPNKLTIARVVMIPIFMVIFYLDFIPYNNIYTALIFLIASFTDFLDGYIARKNNIVTNLGKFLDPIADKVLVSTALILIVEARVVPVPYGAIAVAVILARELIISGFRMVAASTGLVLAADKLGKIKTVFQDTSIFVLLISMDFFGVKGVFATVITISGYVLLGLAVIFTIWSGVSYLVKNKQVLTINK